jgi:hypothetical protein
MHVTARALAVALAIALAAGFGAACSNAPSKGDCEKLRDKLIDLEFAAMGAKAQSGEERDQLAKQKQETSEGVAAQFAEACTKKTPKAVIDCALAATSLEQVKQCDEAKE